MQQNKTEVEEDVEEKPNTIIVSGIKMEAKKDMNLTEKLEIFLAHTFGKEIRVASLTKLGSYLCMVELANYEDKPEILSNKWKLRAYTPAIVYVYENLRQRQAVIEKAIDKRVYFEKASGGHAIPGYASVKIDGVNWFWQDRFNKLVTDRFIRNEDRALNYILVSGKMVDSCDGKALKRKLQQFLKEELRIPTEIRNITKSRNHLCIVELDKHKHKQMILKCKYALMAKGINISRYPQKTASDELWEQRKAHKVKKL